MDTLNSSFSSSEIPLPQPMDDILNNNPVSYNDNEQNQDLNICSKIIRNDIPMERILSDHFSEDEVNDQQMEIDEDENENENENENVQIDDDDGMDLRTENRETHFITIGRLRNIIKHFYGGSRISKGALESIRDSTESFVLNLCKEVSRKSPNGSTVKTNALCQFIRQIHPEEEEFGFLQECSEFIEVSSGVDGLDSNALLPKGQSSLQLKSKNNIHNKINSNHNINNNNINSARNKVVKSKSKNQKCKQNNLFSFLNIPKNGVSVSRCPETDIENIQLN